MGAAENEHIFGVQLRESADDGSDFSNADADYRKLFLGEDGSLHLKDSAGSVTTIGGGGVTVEDEGTPLATTATTLDFVGSGVVASGTGATKTITIAGGGGSVPIVPSIFKTYAKDAQNTASWSKSITAVETTRRLIVAVCGYARDVNTPTLTNVTFTEVLSVLNGSVDTSLSVFVGVPSSTSGTTLGITATGSNWIIADVYEVDDALTGSVIDTATLTGENANSDTATRIGPATGDIGDFYVAAYAQNDGTGGFGAVVMAAGDVLATHISPGGNAGLVSLIGRAPVTDLYCIASGGSVNGDLAAGIVLLS